MLPAMCTLPVALLVGKKRVHKRFQHIAKGKHRLVKLEERYFLFSVPKKKRQMCCSSNCAMSGQAGTKKATPCETIPFWILHKSSRASPKICSSMDFLAQWKLFSNCILHSPTRQPASIRRQHALKALCRQQPADCPLLLLAGAVHLWRRRGWKVHF